MIVRELKVKPIIFVHIPKTAGTSFRVAAKAWFGSSKMLYDYGSQARKTSTLFRRVDSGKISWDKALWKIRNSCFVSGHFPAQRYLSEFGPEHFCTFLRDPVKRTISQYFHHKNALGYSESMETFVEDARFHNQQSRLLKGLPLDRIGFVGVTESYADSLAVFNSIFGTSLTMMFRNQSKEHGETEVPTPQLIRRIEQLNAHDIALYHSACEALESRLADLGKRL